MTAENFHSGNFDEENTPVEDSEKKDSKDTVRSNGKGGVVKGKATKIRRRRYKPIASMTESQQVAWRAKRVISKKEKKSLAKRSEQKKEQDL
ncbi:hypothetical protein BCON_0146g00090 [Botryotinia convoluta]|uniref:Uncharacterized protein n=1 Tax=Botryotinia convoluta TaxID=54673 RepID=A0A4Z1HTW5_9HELO|nr:hypothetical protein BCON_0146g00090 [Botryotinia convoluta]